LYDHKRENPGANSPTDERTLDVLYSKGPGRLREMEEKEQRLKEKKWLHWLRKNLKGRDGADIV